MKLNEEDLQKKSLSKTSKKTKSKIENPESDLNSKKNNFKLEHEQTLDERMEVLEELSFKKIQKEIKRGIWDKMGKMIFNERHVKDKRGLFNFIYKGKLGESFYDDNLLNVILNFTGLEKYLKNDIDYFILDKKDAPIEQIKISKNPIIWVRNFQPKNAKKFEVLLKASLFKHDNLVISLVTNDNDNLQLRVSCSKNQKEFYYTIGKIINLSSFESTTEFEFMEYFKHYYDNSLDQKKSKRYIEDWEERNEKNNIKSLFIYVGDFPTEEEMKVPITRFVIEQEGIKKQRFWNLSAQDFYTFKINEFEKNPVTIEEKIKLEITKAKKSFIQTYVKLYSFVKKYNSHCVLLSTFSDLNYSVFDKLHNALLQDKNKKFQVLFAYYFLLSDEENGHIIFNQIDWRKVQKEKKIILEKNKFYKLFDKK